MLPIRNRRRKGYKGTRGSSRGGVAVIIIHLLVGLQLHIIDLTQDYQNHCPFFLKKTPALKKKAFENFVRCCESTRCCLPQQL
jgi:hypothetical protein